MSPQSRRSRGRSADRAVHTLLINDLLTRFFQAFDDKNWAMMRGCLCDEVFTDYSSFRNTPASTITADEYVEQRRAALQALDMQHNFHNLRVELDAAATAAQARCNFVIYRFHPSFDRAGDDYFHSFGHYVFSCARGVDAWRIAGITQSVLRSLGNREIRG